MTDISFTPELTNEDQVIQYTQQLRLRLLAKITEREIPVDKDSVDIMLRAAADMDRAALGSKRIKTDDKNAAADRLAASAIAKMYSQLGNGDPFANGADVDGGKPAHPAQLLAGVTLMEGEADIGIVKETYEQFQQRVGEA